MKKIFLFTTVLCLLLSGCMNDSKDLYGMADIALDTKTEINVRASTTETISNNDVTEPVIFTGKDILWYNETTREIRFQNNLSMKAAFSNVETLKFYIEDEYLFSAFVFMNSTSTQIINYLVFYYNTVENKYYLLTGYPPDSATNAYKNPESSDTIGNNIDSEWEKFIDQLKKDGKFNK